jgi:diguanylate cyclase (GGDEF)-like protein
MDRRALLGLIAGLAGTAAGVGAVVLRIPALAMGAAAAALVAGAASLQLADALRRLEADTQANAALAQLADVPAPVRHEPATLIDSASGLPDRRFFELAVGGRVAAAQRRLWPVTVVLVEVGPSDAGDADAAVAAFALLARRTLRDCDIACRLGPLTFGMVLEDTSEEGGVWTAERLQIAVAEDVSHVRRLAAGVASYPTHGLHADEVMARAQAALTRACAAEAGRGLGQVEVAQADLT